MVFNLTKTDSKVEKIKYPDGQVSVKLNVLAALDYEDTIWIASRFNNYEDLMYILAATEVLHYHNIEVSLRTTCFLGQRSDDRFYDNQSFDLKIYTDILNAQNYQCIDILHPHSNVLSGLLNHCKVTTNNDLVDTTVDHLEKIVKEKVVLVSPDAGAYKAIFKHAKRLNRELVTANKSRDKQGNLNTHVDAIFDKGETCLIVDDYCDGGRTFIELAKQLRQRGAKNVYLCVTHGLFSAGYQELAANLTGIYCTNSISDIDDMGTWLTQYKII